MPAQQLSCGEEAFSGLLGTCGAARRTFGKGSAANLIDLRRNGPVCVQFPCFASVQDWSGRMIPAGRRHVPVLCEEAIGLLAPRASGIYVDATFGAGGYTRAILKVEGTRVIAIDRDQTAIAGGFDLVDQSNGRLTLV